MATAIPTLIVPGFHGSGPDHWQTWLETQLPDCTRIDGINWNEPVLAQWAGRVREALARAPQPLRIVAHSFGCLAAVIAAADRPEQVSQLILVAPADADRFDCMGLKPDLALANGRFSLSHVLPRSLQVRGLLIASRNDPWLTFEKATALAQDWALDLHDAGYAGHINTESSYGPWPKLLKLLAERAAATPAATAPSLRKGRGSALAAVRQLTREQMQSPQDHRLWQTASH
ncbi:MAG: alpha/beta hydrolase [Pseudomonadota bacterium]